MVVSPDVGGMTSDGQFAQLDVMRAGGGEGQVAKGTSGFESSPPFLLSLLYSCVAPSTKFVQLRPSSPNPKGCWSILQDA